MPKSLGLLGEAIAAESGFTFLQISDSHVGFNKPANPDALGTLREAVAKVKALSRKPASSFTPATSRTSPSPPNSTMPGR